VYFRHNKQVTGSKSPHLLGIIASAAAVFLAASLLVATPASAVSPSTSSGVWAAATAPTSPAAAATPVDTSIREAANLSQFKPGNIISDAVFFQGDSMSAGQIDSFFRGKVASCRGGYVCLKDYRQNTPNRPADNYCRGYSGAANESAATIIARVAQSCGINPRVLIVMLEKEQSLVTHTWPSSWRFDKALGQGCPDTAPCDPAYAGFFYQIYGAARQMQIYAEGRWFTYYAPGKTWNILYHPNRACGSAPVRVENKATAALYYYTPYQPNRAALNAGYGSGDGCSSYGNRNFYQFFTDWFGSTQTGGPASGTLAQVPGRAEIYLVQSGVRHHVVASEDYAALRSRLGTAVAAAASYLDSMPEGKPVTRYVHDPRTGTLYLLEPDGTRHRFVDAAQVALFGYVFGSYVNLTGATADRFSEGAPVGSFFRSGAEPEVYLYQGGLRRHVANQQTWLEVSRGTSGYVASMKPSAAASIGNGLIVIMANSLVRAVGSKDVYLTLLGDRLLRIPSTALAGEFGATSLTVVPSSSVAANTKVGSTLTPVVSCGNSTLIAAGGKLYPVSGTQFGGIKTTMLGSGECGAMPRAKTTVSAPLFLQPQGAAEIYFVSGGTLRHVQSPADLVALNGSRPLQVLPWSQATVKWFGTGAAYLPEKSFVRFDGRAEIYRYYNGTLHHVRSIKTLLQLNGGTPPREYVLPGEQLSRFKVGSPLLTSGADFVQFTGAPEIYLYENGKLRHVTSIAILLKLGGGRAPAVLQLAPAFKADYSVGAPIT
jgi:hypothetical protein